MADYTNDFSLKFEEGKILDFPTYSIAVPDGFEAKTNVDGRDFVIYRRFDPDDEINLTDEDLLYTEIKLSHTPQQVGLVVEGDCTTQHTADVLTAVLFPRGGRGGSLRRFKTDLSVGFIEPWDNSFYITIVVNKSIFRMWLLVQDPEFFEDPTGEFPEISEKNMKDIEKMVKKWVSTIRSKESAENDEPIQVDMERMRELETTRGNTVSNARRKDAEDADTPGYSTAARTNSTANLSGAQNTDAAEADAVMRFLNEHRWQCFSTAQLIAEGAFPNTTQSQDAVAVCNKLVAAGRAEKGVLKGKTVFMAPGTFDAIEGIKPYRRV